MPLDPELCNRPSPVIVYWEVNDAHGPYPYIGNGSPSVLTRLRHQHPDHRFHLMTPEELFNLGMRYTTITRQHIREVVNARNVKQHMG